jgi:hypothetical protein
LKRIAGAKITMSQVPCACVERVTFGHKGASGR